MGSEGQQDIEMAILTALLKGTISTVWVLLNQTNMFVFFLYNTCYLYSLSAPLFHCHQAQMPQQLTSSVWLWPGTEWILLAITSLFMDIIYQ